MILHNTEVMRLTNYRLFLSFNNGQYGEVNLAYKVDGEVFGALRDPALFATASQHPVMRTVAWAKGADLALEFLCELMQAERQHQPT